MAEKQIRILLMADEPDEVQLLEEAFVEMEETRYGRGWPLSERVYAVSLEDGLAALARERFDVIMMDAGLQGFLRVHREAPRTPIVVLAAAEDEALALSLVRQGAQDYLIKSELDCVPLARALGCSMERSRFAEGRQSVTLMDELTALYNERGMTHLGERYWSLALEHKLHVLVMQATLTGMSEVALIEAAELLRGTFSETDLIGRTGKDRFTVIALLAGKAAAEEKVEQVSRELAELSALQLGWAHSDRGSLADLLALAEESLCENRLVENRAGRYL